MIVIKVKKGEAIDKAVKRRLKSVRARSRARSIARRQALAATLPRI